MSQLTNTADFGKQATPKAHTTSIDELTRLFRTQCGTFSDREDESIIKFSKDADEFMRTNSTPSLEMGSIILRNLEGEPYIRAIRWRTSGDFNSDKVHADHWSHQPYQAATPTTREQPEIEGNNCLKKYLLCSFPKRIESYTNGVNSTTCTSIETEQVRKSETHT